MGLKYLLIALGIGVAVRCDRCIAYHVNDTIPAGATRQEIMETIGITVLMGGGPVPVHACEALDQFETEGPTAPAAGEAETRKD